MPSLIELGEDVDVAKLQEAIRNFAKTHPGMFAIIRKDEEGGFCKDFDLLDDRQLKVLDDFNQVDMSQIDPEITALDKSDHWLKEEPNKELVVFKDSHYTYQQVDLISNRIANELMRLGVKAENKADIHR